MSMEWWGNFHFAHARWVQAIITTISVLAVIGLTRLQFDDDARTLFRVHDSAFATLEKFYADFGADDQDVHLMIDGPNLFSPTSLAALRRTHDAMKKLPDIKEVSSLYEIRKGGPIPLMVMPLDDLTPERIDRARKDTLGHAVALGHFLSSDANTTVMSLRLADPEPKIEKLEIQIRLIRQTAQTALSTSGLRLRIAGHPPTRVDLLSTLRTEVGKFALFSAVISGAIALWIFRSAVAVFVAITGPPIGILWVLGLMGWAGAKIDPISVVLPTLLLVVGFTDAVHIISEIQTASGAGMDRRSAVAHSVKHLASACLLTAFTTMLAFGSLAIAKTDCIVRFGVTCAVGTLVMFFATQLVVPALAMMKFADALGRGQRPTASRFWTWAIEPMYRQMLLRPRRMAAISVGFTLIAFVASLNLRSDQRWTEALPHSSETVQVAADGDRIFGGSMFAYVVVQWPEKMSIRSTEVLQTLEAVHAAANDLRVLRGPFSVLTVLEGFEWQEERLSDRVRHLRRFRPETLNRLLRAEKHLACVSIHTPDVGAAILRPEFERLESKLREIEANHPGFKLQLTGTVVVAARNVYQMIGDLAWSLTLASTLIFVTITILFRSLTFGFLSIVPNLLPQAIASSLLVVIQEPLTMTSVLTFSLCLGLSVDDTIHYLMRFREERRQGTPRAAVLRTFRAVGAVMINTTLVLMAGFIAMLVSQMPSVRMFAILSCATLAAAILGDLVILPSLLLSLTNIRTVGRQGTS